MGTQGGERSRSRHPIGPPPADSAKKYAVVELEKGPPGPHPTGQLWPRWGDYSLKRFKLDTGRTHQIRVPLRPLGHPILGDAPTPLAVSCRSPSTWGQALQCAARARPSVSGRALGVRGPPAADLRKSCWRAAPGLINQPIDVVPRFSGAAGPRSSRARTDRHAMAVSNRETDCGKQQGVVLCSQFQQLSRIGRERCTGQGGEEGAPPANTSWWGRKSNSTSRACCTRVPRQAARTTRAGAGCRPGASAATAAAVPTACTKQHQQRLERVVQAQQGIKPSLSTLSKEAGSSDPAHPISRPSSPALPGRASRSRKNLCR